MSDKNYSVLISVLHMDEYYTIDSWPQEGDKVEIKPHGKQPGGRVANTSCVMAKLGDDVRFFDVLSNDASDAFLLDDLKKYGVNVDGVSYVDGLVNSRCMNILSKRDKTCLKIVNPKPKVKLSNEQWELFLNANYIYCAMGFHELLENSRESFATFIKHGARLAMDIEEGFSVEDQQYYFGISDVLFFNHYGFESNAKISGGEEIFLQSLFKKGVKFVVITLGKDGCKVITNKKTVYEAAYDIDVVDPSGAGDTFNGAFLHGLMKGWSVERCAKFAIAASNYCVSTFGPRSGAVPEEKIMEFIKDHK
ncbi:MAG: carbohydrate kinase family protein [Oscillospiraceae bacterium]